MNYESIQIAYNKKEINSIHEKEDVLYLMVKAYLKFNCTPTEYVYTTLDEIISNIGYSIKGGNRRNHNVVKSILSNMIVAGDITIDNFDGIRVSEFMKIKINNYERFFYCNNNFVMLNYKEFLTITKCTASTTKANLFLGFLLIKQYIYDNAEFNSPKVAYPSKNSIRLKMHCSTTTVESVIRDLVNSKLLYTSEHLFIYKNGSFVPARNVYALDENQIKMSKSVLKEFYNVDKIYTLSETNGCATYKIN